MDGAVDGCVYNNGESANVADVGSLASDGINVDRFHLDSDFQLMRLVRTLTRMASTISQRPVVAVIGTTGSGKSQLAVSLAQSLASRTDVSRGVILSADSMQLYRGLDVITNKVTDEEMGGVEHWGLDVVTPGEGGSWEVGKWCGEATKKVSPMRISYESPT